MYHYAGIDVSLECSSVCLVDGTGKILREARVASEPEALITWLRSLGLVLERIGLEAGPRSQWLYAAMRDAGLAVELLETRHVRDAFKAMSVKSDRNDARGIAQLMRLGWFRPVHCKSIEAQETRAVLTARKLLQSKLRDIENSLRGVLRGFGLKVGTTTERTFAERIRELVAGHPGLEIVAQALLEAHAVLRREFNGLDKHTQQLARSHPQARLLMTTPSVGPAVRAAHQYPLVQCFRHVLLVGKAPVGSCGQPPGASGRLAPDLDQSLSGEVRGAARSGHDRTARTDLKSPDGRSAPRSRRVPDSAG